MFSLIQYRRNLSTAFRLREIYIFIGRANRPEMNTSAMESVLETLSSKRGWRFGMVSNTPPTSGELWSRGVDVACNRLC